MKLERLALALTVVNLGLFVYQASSPRPVAAQATVPMLRGRGIEIVDDQGRLRAQLKVEPANESVKMPNGKGMAETVIFRLITADGKPRVKITTSDHGSGIGLVGESDTTHVVLQADLSQSSLKLRNDEATQQVFKP